VLEDVPRQQATPKTIFIFAEVARGASTSAEVASEPRRSSRFHVPPERYGDKVLLLDNNEPATYKEAMMGPNSI
jgi:hypothetical protein